MTIAARNRYSVAAGVVTMYLSGGYRTLLDYADIPLVARWRWWPINIKGHIYAQTRLDGAQTILLHRLIWGAWDERQVKHKNGNTLDNRRSNLRWVGIRQTRRGRYAYYRAKLNFRHWHLERYFPHTPAGLAWAERWLADQHAAIDRQLAREVTHVS